MFILWTFQRKINKPELRKDFEDFCHLFGSFLSHFESLAILDENDAIRSLADDSNIVIERADKGSCLVLWGVKEAEIQLSDQNF